MSRKLSNKQKGKSAKESGAITSNSSNHRAKHYLSDNLLILHAKETTLNKT